MRSEIMNKISRLFGVTILGSIAGLVAGELTIGKARKRAMHKIKEDDLKFHEFYSLLLQWIHMHNDGKKISTYLKSCGYHTVAIYGMKELGEELFYELKNSDIEVKYAIDKNADDLYAEIDIYRPDEELEIVDAVIVTAIHWFDDIERDMRQKLVCPILSLEDVVYNA